MIAGEDHGPVRISGLRRLKGLSPLHRIELAAKVLLDCEVKGLAVLVAGFEESRQARSVEEKGSICLDPLEARNVGPASDDTLQARGQPDGVRGASAGKRHKQVEVGPRVLVPARHGAVEHGQLDAALGSQRPAKLGEQLPVALQVLALARSAQLAPRRRKTTGTVRISSLRSCHIDQLAT